MAKKVNPLNQKDFVFQQRIRLFTNLAKKQGIKIPSDVIRIMARIWCVRQEAPLERRFNLFLDQASRVPNMVVNTEWAYLRHADEAVAAIKAGLISPQKIRILP